MSRKTSALKPQLNRIRAWAQEGSTDAWIAHQLGTTADVIAEFRAEQAIGKSGPAPVMPITPDQIVEAMLAEEEAGSAPTKRRRTRAPAAEEPVADAAEGTPDEAEEPPAPKRRRRTKATIAAESTDAPPESTVATEPASGEEPGDAGVDEPASGEAAPRPRRRRRSAAERADEAETSPAETPIDEPTAVPGTDLETDSDPESSDAVPATSTRRRRRRGGRGRGSGGGASGDLRAQAVPGRVIVLGEAITGNATFREHWSDASTFSVEVSSDTITLRRSE